MSKVFLKFMTTCLTTTALFFSGLCTAAAEENKSVNSPTISVTSNEISPESIENPYIAAAGAWARSGTGPSLTNKGLVYTLNLPVLGSVPAGSAITTVNYKWNLSYLPSGLAVYLCWDTTSSCVNVSSNKTGSLSNFAGLNANKKFIFAFLVSGSGAISPVAYGQTNQVIVNYE